MLSRRNAFGICDTKNSIYVIGGISDNENPVKLCERYCL